MIHFISVKVRETNRILIRNSPTVAFEILILYAHARTDIKITAYTYKIQKTAPVACVHR